MHNVEERLNGEIWVQLSSSPEKYDSDEYASSAACGTRVALNDIAGAKKGRDGVIPSGLVIAEQRWKSCKVRRNEKDGEHGIRLVVDVPDSNFFSKRLSAAPLLMLNAAELFQAYGHVAARVGSIERFFTPLDSEYILEDSQHCIVLSIRVYSHGSVSYSLSRLKPGDTLDLRVCGERDLPSCDLGDLRRAAFLPQKFKRVVLLAAGSGITPMLGVCRSVLKSTPESTVTVFCCDKSPNTALCRDLLAAYSAKHAPRVSVIRLFSKSIESQVPVHGETLAKSGCRFTENTFRSLFNCAMCEGEERVLFSWCGPTTFCESIPAILKNCGFDDRQNAFFVPYVG